MKGKKKSDMPINVNQSYT